MLFLNLALQTPSQTHRDLNLELGALGRHVLQVCSVAALINVWSSDQTVDQLSHRPPVCCRVARSHCVSQTSGVEESGYTIMVHAAPTPEKL